MGGSPPNPRKGETPLNPPQPYPAHTPSPTLHHTDPTPHHRPATVRNNFILWSLNFIKKHKRCQMIPLNVLNFHRFQKKWILEQNKFKNAIIFACFGKLHNLYSNLSFFGFRIHFFSKRWKLGTFKGIIWNLLCFIFFFSTSKFGF